VIKPWGVQLLGDLPADTEVTATDGCNMHIGGLIGSIIPPLHVEMEELTGNAYEPTTEALDEHCNQCLNIIPADDKDAHQNLVFFMDKFNTYVQYLMEVQLAIDYANDQRARKGHEIINVWTLPRPVEELTTCLETMKCSEGKVEGANIGHAEDEDGYNFQDAQRDLLSFQKDANKGVKWFENAKYFCKSRPYITTWLLANYATHLKGKIVRLTDVIPAHVLGDNPLLTALAHYQSYEQLIGHVTDRAWSDDNQTMLRRVDMKIDDGFLNLFMRNGLIQEGWVDIKSVYKILCTSLTPSGLPNSAEAIASTDIHERLL
jgi:hypothetical protein